MKYFAKVLFLTLLLFSPWLHAANPQIEFRTNMGSFVVELYPDKAPKTVANFLAYVNSGFYEGTIFHRVIDRFVVQGGGMTTDMHPKKTMEPIPNEADNGLKNDYGTLAMARRLQPDSATSQFFINLAENKTLNYYRPEPALMGYCVFGRVVRGMNVLEQIGHLPTRAIGKMTDVPSQDVVIEKAAVLETPVFAENAAPNQAEEQPVKSSKSAKKGKNRG